jgi:hypothetical protein
MRSASSNNDAPGGRSCSSRDPFCARYSLPTARTTVQVSGRGSSPDRGQVLAGLQIGGLLIMLPFFSVVLFYRSDRSWAVILCCGDWVVAECVGDDGD